MYFDAPITSTKPGVLRVLEDGGDVSRGQKEGSGADIGTASMTCTTRIASGPLCPHTKFQRNASGRSRDTEKGHARADVPQSTPLPV